ncbi:MAG: hypothetical protein A2157_13535 [Deltaproteobacteria bacterium RBG_16_47_11]|nr:MAG: hypothetical protein A2157_13535 [Deltaproteobacteria bacterium RBG_16_47_11]
MGKLFIHPLFFYSRTLDTVSVSSDGEYDLSFSPRGAPSKRLRYGRQNKTLVSFRLLLFVMLHGDKILKNEEEVLFSAGFGWF